MALSLVSVNRILVRQLPAIQAAVNSFGAANSESRRQASTDLAQYKRGTGGRSSFSGIIATVFGASGFLGRYVVNKLGKIGSQVVIPYRGDSYDVQRLKVAGDLGQILFLPYDLRDENSIKKAMKYSNVVINLVGRDWETKNFSFDQVHVEGTRRIAQAAREAGVETLLHVSALNASPSPPNIFMKNGSRFLQSKHMSENVVREEFPNAIIMRPSDMYGQEDRFLRYYANRYRRTAGMMQMWHSGKETLKQPVHVVDVAQGIVNAIRNPEFLGKSFDAVGPHRYQLDELVHYFYRCMRRDNFKITPMTPLFRIKAAVFEKLALTYPVLNPERLEREFITDTVSGGPTLEDLGVVLSSLEERAAWELRPFRQHKYYLEQLGEFPDPAPPPHAA